MFPKPSAFTGRLTYPALFHETERMRLRDRGEGPPIPSGATGYHAVSVTVP